ncbi:MAG: MarC family protein [Odoribacteraceae bacterium]|jgi:multiple antibiotic resistance protein|nr:MarC family protein [Odoribacteraceae bacterium]
MEYLVALSLKEIASTFMVLFAVIDITGSVPIILQIMEKGNPVNAFKAAGLSLVVLVAFLFIGEVVLSLFSVDVSSFAVAGALVIFVLACEMIFGIEVFKNDGPPGAATVVPLVFPLIAGAGTLTTLVSLRAEYHVTNILIAVLLNVIVIYIVLKKVSLVEKIFGKGGVYLLRKVFGIILLAVSVKLFTTNLAILINTLNSATGNAN